ncbi:MAG: phosphoenolpyruvate carboxykinase, partial [Nanoarchaeota archaeon]|nr:phosphoenolpyruvate carboxykinase [Nanoarchaeota archaeon]
MLFKKKGTDILLETGGIKSFDGARSLFEKKLNRENLSRILKINQQDVHLKIANSIAMCQPDSVFINTGSEEDRQYIRELALKNREEAKLAMKGHTIHFDLKKEQGRITDRTYYIANEDEKVSSLANKT